MCKESSLLSTGKNSAVVEFSPEAISGIEPPNPEFLAIHAAFAKVLHLSGAAEFADKVEREAEGVSLCMHQTDYFAAALSSKLAIWAH